MTKEQGEFKPRVTVQMDKEMIKSHEFLAVTYDPTTGEHSIRYNCDAVTAGIAYRMAAKAFADLYDSLTPAQRKEVDSIFKPDGEK